MTESRPRVLFTFENHSVEVGPLSKVSGSREKDLGITVGEVHLIKSMKLVVIEDAGKHKQLENHAKDEYMVLTHVGETPIFCKEDYSHAVNTNAVGESIRLKFADLRTRKRAQIAEGEEPDAKRSRVDKAKAGVTSDIHEEKLAKQEAESVKALCSLAKAGAKAD